MSSNRNIFNEVMLLGILGFATSTPIIIQHDMYQNLTPLELMELEIWRDSLKLTDPLPDNPIEVAARVLNEIHERISSPRKKRRVVANANSSANQTEDQPSNNAGSSKE